MAASLDRHGLFRTVLAGTGNTLADVFANLEDTPQLERVSRHGTRDLLGGRVSLPSEEGEGYWEFTRIRDEIYVVVANFAYKEPRLELVPGDGLIQFAFKISGDMTLDVCRADTLRWNRPSLLVWTQPKGVNISEWTAPCAHERYVTISVRPEFITEQLSASGSDLPKPLQAFMCAEGGSLEYRQLPLNPLMFDAATRLLDNPFTGVRGLVFTEAQTLALLCSALDSFSHSSPGPIEEYSEHKLRRLHAARGLLMRQFSPPPNIGRLARAVGMAESTLTKGFKAVFGQTIFEFSLQCRMQRAMSLIRDERWSVAKASDAVGYAHPTSFTTAFRRHFGVRPTELRSLKAGGN